MKIYKDIIKKYFFKQTLLKDFITGLYNRPI